MAARKDLNLQLKKEYADLLQEKNKLGNFDKRKYSSVSFWPSQKDLNILSSKNKIIEYKNARIIEVENRIKEIENTLRY